MTRKASGFWIVELRSLRGGIPDLPAHARARDRSIGCGLAFLTMCLATSWVTSSCSSAVIREYSPRETASRYGLKSRIGIGHNIGFRAYQHPISTGT